MGRLKTGVMVIYVLGFLSLVALILMTGLGLASSAHGATAYMAIVFLVTASLFAVLGLVKGDIHTEELYQSALSGVLAVSIFPVSAVVGLRTSQTLIDVVQALFA